MGIRTRTLDWGHEIRVMRCRLRNMGQGRKTYITGLGYYEFGFPDFGAGSGRSKYVICVHLEKCSFSCNTSPQNFLIEHKFGKCFNETILFRSDSAGNVFPTRPGNSWRHTCPFPSLPLPAQCGSKSAAYCSHGI